MFKKLMKGMLMGGALLALTIPAQAAEININLYGASAQHLFWNDAADNFLTSKLCTGVGQDEYNSKHGITRGTCGTDIVYIRYSSKASYDGIYAVKGAVDTDTCEGQSGVPANQGKFYRKMVNEDTCTSWTLPGTNCTGLKCVEVTIGASDVDGSSFLQSSFGYKYGHKKTGGVVTNSFPPGGVNTSGLTSYQPVVVPFGFFANNSVTKTKCIGPDPLTPTPSAHKAVSTWGYQCYDPNDTGNSADCIGYYKCIAGKCSGGTNVNQNCSSANMCPDVALEDTVCERIPLDNISRLQAVMIYSGQATNWNNFGAWYPNLPIVACLRHAGSGTHATLDWAVMRSSKSDWGWPLLTDEDEFGSLGPITWFNDGSGDMMACVNELQGAIGYADADQLEGTSNFENVHALKYNGVEPRRTKVRNGEYDFYSNQWLYTKTLTGPLLAWVQNLDAFAKIPGNIPGSKARFWATKAEMKYNKTNDRLYPGFVGATSPQLP